MIVPASADIGEKKIDTSRNIMYTSCRSPPVVPADTLIMPHFGEIIRWNSNVKRTLSHFFAS
jgi:hypothetical protein